MGELHDAVRASRRTSHRYGDGRPSCDGREPAEHDASVIANGSNPVDRGGFDWTPDSAAIPEEHKQTERWSWTLGQASTACGRTSTVSFP